MHSIYTTAIMTTTCVMQKRLVKSVKAESVDPGVVQVEYWYVDDERWWEFANWSTNANSKSSKFSQDQTGGGG